MENQWQMVNRTVLHVDLNSFFATCEQQANPYLRNKPVGIIKASGRTCVIAASVEAKKSGVETGTDIFEAKRLCPEIIFVPADFDKYADVTYRFIDICKSYSPECEVFSLDECFIDVTGTEKFWSSLPTWANLEHLAMFEMWTVLRGKTGRGAVNIAYEVKKRLRDEIGDYMTCSAGISHNRFLAKLASNQIKPDGLFWITPDNMLAVLDRSKLTDVCGLGFGLYSHLSALGIDSFPKLRACSLEFLHKHFGPYWSVHLYNLARGIDDSTVVPMTEIPDAKSVGRTYTTHRNLTKEEEILRLMRNLCEEAAAKARQMKLAGRYVGLTLRGGSGVGSYPGWLANRSFSGGWYGHRTLKNYINDGKVFFDICLGISKGWPIKSIRFCGVTLGMLTRSDYLSAPLFPADRQREDLTSAVDRVNKRFGDYTVFPAQLLGMPIIMPEVNGFFGDKKFRLGNFLREN